MTVVCIAGMHRSGTSMVARLLNLCGIYLGSEEEIIHAASDNPEGFFENVRFLEINDKILSSLGGAWDSPPAINSGWESDQKLISLQAQAEDLIKRFEGKKLWGWKDPRNSLTLPFWQQLIPEVKVIVCLRNPLEVAQSLAWRSYSSNRFSFNLWLSYNQRLLSVVSSNNRLITNYEVFFINPKAELHRLLEFINITVDEQQIERACAIIDSSLKHNRANLEDLLSTGASAELAYLYTEMCQQAGSVYWGAIHNDLQRSYSANSINSFSKIEGLGLPERLVEKQQLLTAQLAERQKATQSEQTSVEDLEIQIHKLQTELQKIESRFGVQLLNKYNSFVHKLMPQGTRRRLLYDLGIDSAHLLLANGPLALWRRIKKQLVLSDIIQTIKDLREQEKNRIVIRTPLTPAPSNQDMYAEIYNSMLAVARGKQRSEYVLLAEESLMAEQSPVKLIAFYLPQFHPIPENDRWWGKGFTEWTNVSKAVPQFIGHYQPHLPGELGFYDLRAPDVQRRQVELAKKYGIYGFCFYYYWFNGKHLLERPLEQYVSDSEIDFPFCLCWANENWTRRWDGLENDILIAQEHTKESDFAFIKDINPFLRHKNYIRINGRPLLIVYRTQLMPDPAATAARWKDYCQQTGIEEPYLVAAQTFGFTDPRPINFDAAVEFPPLNLNLREISSTLTPLNPDYMGKTYQYKEIVDILTNFENKQEYKLFKTVFPNWDNEPRRPGRGVSFAFSTPDAYKHWLMKVCQYAFQASDPEERLVFINAWNEWGEGAHLEPDRRYGYAYLQATADALRSFNKQKIESNIQDEVRPRLIE